VSLLQRAEQAAFDELRHARLCARVASAFGPPYAPPTPRPVVRRPLSGRVGLERLACESFVDGCLGEGLAASLARDTACSTAEPLVANVQRTIAVDEHRHAGLAWDIVRWCLERDPRVARALGAVSSTELEPPATLTGHRERHSAIAREHRAASRARLKALAGRHAL
jgi:hypothetical protein